MHADVTIIGAGLAGLCCASALIAGGARVQVLEASDGVGGRVQVNPLMRPQAQNVENGRINLIVVSVSGGLDHDVVESLHA